MRDLTKVIQVSEKLMERLEFMRRILGDKWADRAAEIKPAIQALMEKVGSDNPLEVVLPVAKEMSAENNDPSMLLAVATEMVLDIQSLRR